ncbi:MAG TPA: ABC transporter permease [Kiritimatiellae bacterium]|nr:ABC transporter permease [Kiritimatiellia bacterium]
MVLPPGRWPRIDWREIWQYRELLYFLTWRDVKVRYKQTMLGVGWAFLQPFLKLVVFSAVFGKLARLDSEGFPYPIFVYAGLLPWQFFSESLQRSSQSVVGAANLIRKVYFPRLIIPLASIGACLVDFGISFSILAGLMMYYHVPLRISLMLVPALVLLTVFIALGVGTLFSALNAAYRDFRYIVPFMVQIWMYLTPVIYSARAVPARWRFLLALNPMTGVVNGYRSAVLGTALDMSGLFFSLAAGLSLFIVAVYFFRKIESQMADIV